MKKDLGIHSLNVHRNKDCNILYQTNVYYSNNYLNKFINIIRAAFFCVVFFFITTNDVVCSITG